MLKRTLSSAVCNAIKEIYQIEIDINSVQIQKTKTDFIGDLTIVTFPFTKITKTTPEIIGEAIGNFLINNVKEIESYNVIKGFLNINFTTSYWLSFIENCYTNDGFFIRENNNKEKIIIEFSSPNTNKPLHLGHIRNNLIGWSVAELLKANGNEIKRISLVNDRGIHICKSMLAWMKWGNGETPETSGIKGDFLAGKYYVLFEQKLKEEVKQIISNFKDEDDARKNASLMLEAQDLLKKWELGNADVIALWKKMNQWVYKGFEVTYKTLGIVFDAIDYESQNYISGKKIIEDGINKGVLNKKHDGSIWIDLTADGLDEKLLLRADGTSVYITQDIGTAVLRHEELNPDKMIYVVGNEQNYHFDVLKLILKKLGYEWADKIYHLSYGMVELPEGKMKSREGTVVDADDLMNLMFETAKNTSIELGKCDNNEDIDDLSWSVGLGALKYFILKVDPKKNMVFNPNESIDFNGNTGPFIQYTYARIQSLLAKAKMKGINFNNYIDSIDKIEETEKQILKILSDFQTTLGEAAVALSPALIANYVYELAKLFNQFYQENPILKGEVDVKNAVILFRLKLASVTGNVIKKSMSILGIDVPDKM